MRILIISTVRYNLNGIASVIKNLYQNETFAKENVTVAIPTESDVNMVEELRQCGHNVLLYDLHAKLHNPLAYIKFLTAHMRENAYDLVHIHGNSHMVAWELIAAKRANCKVRMVHAHSTRCKSMLLHRLLTPMFRHLYTHGLACGQEAGEFMFGTKKDFLVINNAINTARFAFCDADRQSVRAQYALHDRIVIGHVGSFTTVKNQTFLLDVLASLCEDEHQKYALMLLGEGPLMEEMKEKTSALHLSDRVIFIGVTTEVPKYLSACDMIMMPSLFEGLPLTLIEEQANGLVCLASDRITTEANKTGNVQFLSIDNGTQPWVNAAKAIPLDTNRANTSATAIQRIKDCRYDIHEEVKQLHRFYQNNV